MTIYEEFLKKGHKIRPVYDFRQLVYQSAEHYSKENAFVLRDRKISYSEFKNEYRALSTAFIKRGYMGKRIAVVGANSYNWILCYLAAATVGVVVPIDKELDASDVAAFINEASCDAVCGDEIILSKLDLGKSIDFISIAPSKHCETDAVSVENLVESGAKLYAEGLTTIDSMNIDTDEMSILIFTSGTTGNSKGVCLSQKNICANINQTAKMVKIDPTLHSLSVLPLHHTYETTLGHLLLLSGGACISYADGLRQVAKNINEYRPSVLIVVPLLLDFILKRIEANLRKSLPAKLIPPEGTPLKQIIESLPALLRVIVKRKVKKNLGGRLRLLIVGAAPIKPEVIETFLTLGITTYQGYGLTETAPLIAGNNDFYVNPNSVGLPIHGVEIKIENPNEEGIGEIVAKGDNVMLGYFNDEEATENVMRGGYFHTGDMGRFDENGWLYITGRCKNVIIAKNGKNIYPEELEAKLTEEPLISEVLVLGTENSKGDTAIKAKIFPDFEKLKEHFGEKVPTKEEIREEIAAIITRLNDKLPTYKKITVTEILEEAFEKTTTKKIKRFGNNMN